MADYVENNNVNQMPTRQSTKILIRFGAFPSFGVRQTLPKKGLGAFLGVQSPNATVDTAGILCRAGNPAQSLPDNERAKNINMTEFRVNEGASTIWTHSAFIGLPLKNVSALFKDLRDKMKGLNDE